MLLLLKAERIRTVPLLSERINATPGGSKQYNGSSVK